MGGDGGEWEGGCGEAWHSKGANERGWVGDGWGRRDRSGPVAPFAPAETIMREEWWPAGSAVWAGCVGDDMTWWWRWWHGTVSQKCGMSARGERERGMGQGGGGGVTAIVIEASRAEDGATAWASHPSAINGRGNRR